MYDAYRMPPAPPPPPMPPPRKPFWTRPKVGAAGVVLGLLIGFAGSGDGDPAEAAPEEAAPSAPAEVVPQGMSEEEVEARVDVAVDEAVTGLEEDLLSQEEQSAADLEAVRRQAAKAQDKAVDRAVDKAVARALASVPQEPVDAPEPAPAAAPEPAPAPSTDPRFEYCSDATAAGYGNYVAGQDPEYDWYDDADGDGVVCET